MFNRVNGEKKLLALINATVSHEMRNPLNSIHSQNLKQTQISEKFKELIDSDFS
jgi:signal transduction histidine kinase